MSQKTIGLTQAALNDLIDRYLHRTLTLEIELRQMIQEKAISVNQYKKRVLYLTQFKSQIRFLQSQLSASDQGSKSVFSSSRIPASSSRSPEESQLCINYLQQAGGFAKLLVSESQEVINVVQKTLKGRRFRFLTLFDLSKLRRMILKVGQREDVYKSQRQAWISYSKGVLESVSATMSSNTNVSSSVEGLKNAYREMKLINQEVLSLNLDCERTEADLNLKENWLSFQEWRMSQYHPRHSNTTKARLKK